MEPEVHPAVDAAATNELVKELAQTIGQLVSRHVELAKVEAVTQVKREAKMASLLAGAGVLGHMGLGLLLLAGLFAWHLILPWWASALIMAGIVFGAAGTMAAIGYKRRVKRPLWRTRETIEEDVRWLRPRTV